MAQTFARFLREREVLGNLSRRTLEWHEQSLAWLRIEQPSEADLRDFVFRMRAAGLSASSCNCRIGSVNAFLRWTGSPLRVSKLRQESYVPSTYSAGQVEQIVRWRPKGFYQQRLHALALTLFDTGTRLDEVLSLRVADCNLSDLLLTVTGKGRKQRVIPFSLELRRALARFILDFCPYPQQLLFSTKDGRKLSQRNTLRDFKNLCRKLGFEPPPRSLHATRHTFATAYLAGGGNVLFLQRILGHSSLAMTQRYVNLATADLQAVHERLSLLNRRAG